MARALHKAVFFMGVAGIVTEYNPFHLGHAQQLAALRSRLGAQTPVVCVMSGNFVQRGDFAVFSKQARAEAAVRCGADLVLELPLPFCLSSAEGFALGAVSLLHSLGCVTHLAFGCEDAALPALSRAADAVTSPEADRLTGYWLGTGLSYAAARQKAAAALLGPAAALLKKPNNILAVEYLKALRCLSSPIMPLPLPRHGAGHDDAAPTGYSASALRQLLYDGESLAGLVPGAALAVYQRELMAGRGPAWYKNCERALLARLRSLPDTAWQALPGNAEGLSARLAAQARKGAGLEEILRSCRTKRYALSRIRRMLLCAYLGLSRADLAAPLAYIRPLAFNESGRLLLRGISSHAQLPLIVKPAAGKVLPAFCRDAWTSDLFVLAYPDLAQARGGSEFTQSPCFVRSGASPCAG